MDDMMTYAARLASFDKTHATGRKRGSNAKAHKVAKWAHKTPTPAQMARAGFFYAPTSSSPDNATCFQCHESMDGWEADDDPIKEHLALSSQCSWAITIGVEQSIERGSLEEEDPMSAKMLDARKATFGDSWPHEGKRGWTCKTKKMAEAGWYYCPTPESDDFVRCPYCNLSLDGWEPKDNPYHEHEKRAPECAFFTLSQTVKPYNRKKGRSSKTSQMSRRSNATIISIADTVSLVDEEPQDGDSALTSATNMTVQSTASRSTRVGTKMAKGKGRSRKITTAAGPDQIADSNRIFGSTLEELDFKTKRGTKRMSDEIDTYGFLDEAPQDESTPPPKRTRATRISTVKSYEPLVKLQGEDEDGDTPMDDAETAPPVSKKNSRPKGKFRKVRVGSLRKASNVSIASKAPLRAHVPADEEIDAALEADLDRPLTDDEVEENLIVEIKPKRRLTRTKLSSRAVSASVASARIPSVVVSKKVPTTEPHENVHPSIEPKAEANALEFSSEAIEAEGTRNTKKKAQNGKRKKKEQLHPSMAYGEPLDQLHPRVNEDDSDLMVVNGRVSSVADMENPSGTTTQSNDIQSQPEVQDLPEWREMPKASKSAKSPLESTSIEVALNGEASKGRIFNRKHSKGHSPTPSPNSKHAQSQHAVPGGRISKANGKKGKAKMKTKMVLTPPTSQDHDDSQSSLVISNDSRKSPSSAYGQGTTMSLKQQALKPGGMPLPQTPEKRTVGFTLQPPPSSTPSPQSSDIENRPPSSRPSQQRPPLAPLTPSASQRNLNANANGDRVTTIRPWKEIDIEAVLQEFLSSGPIPSKDALTEEELDMTIEEWILRNGAKGEESLRNRCEKLVNEFESRGLRALQTFEGIECID